MANGVSIAVNMTYQSAAGVAVGPNPIRDYLVAVATQVHAENQQSIATGSFQAINFGNVSSPLWFFCINRDPTNYVEIKTGASSGKIFAKLGPGAPCLVPLGSDAQIPVAQANTGACILEYLVVSL